MSRPSNSLIHAWVEFQKHRNEARKVANKADALFAVDATRRPDIYNQANALALEARRMETRALREFNTAIKKEWGRNYRLVLTKDYAVLAVRAKYGREEHMLNFFKSTKPKAKTTIMRTQPRTYAEAIAKHSRTSK